MKSDPETKIPLYPVRRIDGSMADSAYVWKSLDGRIQLDPTDEEEAMMHARNDTDRAINSH